MRFENERFFLTVYPVDKTTGMTKDVVVFGEKTEYGDEVISRTFYDPGKNDHLFETVEKLKDE